MDRSCSRRKAAFGLLVFSVLAFSLHAQSPAPGFTPGEFAVTETGAASYQIPIVVPPGTAGMEPNLSLSYSSQGGNGILGVGWSLEGLSVIERCGNTLVQDGSTRGVRYTAEDKYCLEGQRLVAVSGQYGADGAEYRTEIESFVRVVSYGSAGSGPENLNRYTYVNNNPLSYTDPSGFFFKKIFRAVTNLIRGVTKAVRARKLSDATYYNWKAKYGGMSASELKRTK